MQLSNNTRRVPRRGNSSFGTLRIFVYLVGAIAAGWVITGVALTDEVQTTSNARPNVVLIFADDLGYGDVSCYPQLDPIRTPNIDRLAQSGIRMTDGYSADPMCLHSRASLLTGKYHRRFKNVRDFPEADRLIANGLNEAGYATACIGKWHNCVPGTDVAHGPLSWGFDEFVGFLGGMHDYFDPDKGYQTGKGWIYMPVYDGTRPVGESKYLTTEFTDRAVDFIQRQKDRPFFLYLPYNAKHTPLQAPDEYLKRNGGDVNAAMIDAMDEGVGRVLDTLDRLDLTQDTLVFFIGDNGGWPGPNWKLRGMKGLLFEGGIRVPFLASWPNRLPAGQVYTQPVMHIDVLPTILAAAGAEIPTEHTLDGQNLLPYLQNETDRPPHDVLFWGRGDRFAVRRGNWKLVNDNDDRDAEPRLGLYNLKEDPQETHNMLEEEKQIAEALSRLHQDWLAEVAPKSGVSKGR